jgi:hypothetical protein
VTAANGKDPAGPNWEAYYTILAVIGAMQVVLVMPPGTPQPAPEALRAAVASLDNDKEYVAEAVRSIGFVPEWFAGADTSEQVRAAVAVRPETRTFITDYIKNAKYGDR